MPYVHPLDKASRRYIAATMEAPYLEREHEFALARRWRDEGDAEALDDLVFAYARLVVKIASGFRGYGLPLDDLVQEGNVGLMQAAARFDPDRHVRFSTYARWWVVAAIQEYILRNASIVRIGITAAQKSLFFKLRRLRARLAEKPDGPMSDADRRCIAAELKVPLAAVERMEAHFSRPDQSLNAPLGMGESDELQDFLTDTGPTPEDIVLARRDGDTRAGWIDEALARLTPRERQIIAGRFLGDDPMTLAELGEVFGVSKERVRQIEAKALDKLRATIGEISADPAELFDA
ncbi:MAG: RNA polymerase factor sigma-32 [Alphaproteobacteria bacterium]